MTQQSVRDDLHPLWMQDIEYRQEFGSENAKLEMAAALVRAREVKDVTQSRLAELAGTSQAYIARLERGDANPTIGTVGRLFASLWLKPCIEPLPMNSSIASALVTIQNRTDSEACVDYSPIRASNFPYSLQIVG